MFEKERNAWRKKREITHENVLSWGEIFKQATEQELDKREFDCNETSFEFHPRRVYVDEKEIYHLDQQGNYWDEVSGKQLNSEEVIAARLIEIKQFQVHDVYEKVPTEVCWEATGKAPVLVKWIDITKGDEVNHEYRSRLVAKEIKMDKRLDLFAATPHFGVEEAILQLCHH